MPAVNTLTEALDNLYTSTWSNLKNEAVDNIFGATPFWAWMKANGRLREIIGGRQILEAVVYAKNDGVQFIGKGASVSLQDRELLTQAVWDWHYLVAPIVRFGTDDHKNRGKNQIMSLMNAKLENAKNSLVDQLEISTFQSPGAVVQAAPATSSGAFDNVTWLVKDDPTTSSVVGTINQATYTWWQNQATNCNARATMNAALADWRNMYNKCMNNRTQDAPDIIVTDQVTYEFYEGIALPTTTVNGILRIANTKMADLGFESLAFKNVPVIWSPQVLTTAGPKGRAYFLNTKYLAMVYDPGLNFDMTEWKPIPEQVNDRAAQIVCACSLVTNRRRVQGVLYNLPQA